MAKFLLEKMASALQSPVDYTLFDVQKQAHALKDWIGKSLEIKFSGDMFCLACAKKINKSFNQGYCYPCFVNDPSCSPCVIRPELCQAHLGLGRDVAWEEQYHNQPHIVYLANSSHIKVGITRAGNTHTRWIDQGASEAIAICQVPNRYLAGCVEVALKAHFPDKTAWQKMLKNTPSQENLLETAKTLPACLPLDLQTHLVPHFEVLQIDYPVLQYPEKIKSVNLDKTPSHQGELMGIKGQYLLFADGSVLNIRKHGGYVVEVIGFG
jgi:hypothetical protein